MEVQEYGRDRLPAGPAIDESDEIIVVEGRADVLNLLKHGFKNCIAINGTSIPETILELCRKKVVTVFVDGDRGGDLIIKEFASIADVDYITKAPDGKEVEEITKKEIHKALRSRVSGEQAKFEGVKEAERQEIKRNSFQRPIMQTQQRPPQFVKRLPVPPEQRQKFRNMLENLVGTRGAQVLDEKMNVLGKVPISELPATIKSLGNGAYAIVFDGTVDRDIVKAAEIGNIKCLVGMDSKVRNGETKIDVLTVSDL